MRQYLLPETGKFYKVNLHCHSTSSDGTQTPEEIKKLFMEKGYSAVAFTEHEMMLDYSYLTDDKFVAITSYEYGIDDKEDNPLSALYEGERKSGNHMEKVHLNLFSKDPHDTRMVCYNPEYVWGNCKHYLDDAKYVGSPDYVRKYTVDGINEVIRAAKDRNMLVVFNHPDWSINSGEIYCNLEGLTGFEIMNGDADDKSDMEYNPHVYQAIARAGKRMCCVGGDDNHKVRTSGKAWTMIKADSLSYENLMSGLEQGNCYASNGPEIYDLYVEDGKVTVHTSEAVGIYLHTAGRRSDHKISEEEGALVTEATFTLNPKDVMFCISVRDTAGNHASTRYYYFDELKEKIEQV